MKLSFPKLCIFSKRPFQFRDVYFRRLRHFNRYFLKVLNNYFLAVFKPTKGISIIFFCSMVEKTFQSFSRQKGTTDAFANAQVSQISFLMDFFSMNCPVKTVGDDEEHRHMLGGGVTGFLWSGRRACGFIYKYETIRCI